MEDANVDVMKIEISCSICALGCFIRLKVINFFYYLIS